MFCTFFKFPMMQNISNYAYAKIKGSSDYPQIFGWVFFYQTEQGVYVLADILGLPDYKIDEKTKRPIGPHGFHIHEFGNCEENYDAFIKTGGHYNPTNQPHGNHAGDFPVLFSNDGRAFIIFLTNKFKVDDIIGKSVIIHENPDDYRTQPAGDSGKRIACGVIRRY
ncbi:Superoxide dismutase [Cu-Zn] precursor [Caloramator mitchellensis]|uniref:Superoxide dismutase [Cu-Zn] n=1 Tax=Caloramator mitchellensis TaxID=908809 RepID=A0A0R3K459_CALMK|nr:superoxide dismutase family protein [Caloramator mitchellensis]KRQ87877.1 Superoxide dismutase [Cu-Zn] precursor [Caloramator mitchellensis]